MGLHFDMFGTKSGGLYYAHLIRIFCGTNTQMSESRIFTHRHEKFHDSLANLLKDICHYVEIDPHLQPKQVETFYLKSSTTNNDAKLVIKADRV